MAIGTTRGKRRLGRYLRPFVEATGMTPEQLATTVRTSPQTIKRLLKGDNLPGFHLFGAVLGALELSGEDKKRALELYEVADADISTIEHAGSLRPMYRRFRLDESEAVLERVIDTVIISGLLQTEAYSKALALANRPAWKGKWDAETFAAERKNRQSVLLRDENPLRLHVLLDERVLDLVVGGPEVMVEQFDHLLKMADRPNVEIRILPKTGGPYCTMSGPLFVLEFPGEDEPDSAYAESVLGMHVVEKDEDVAMLSAVWEGAQRTALSVKESIRVIEAARRGA